MIAVEVDTGEAVAPVIGVRRIAVDNGWDTVAFVRPSSLREVVDFELVLAGGTVDLGFKLNLEVAMKARISGMISVQLVVRIDRPFPPSCSLNSKSSVEITNREGIAIFWSIRTLSTVIGPQDVRALCGVEDV